MNDRWSGDCLSHTQLVKKLSKSSRKGKHRLETRELAQFSIQLPSVAQQALTLQ
jgi:hypothetical protein